MGSAAEGFCRGYTYGGSVVWVVLAKRLHMTHICDPTDPVSATRTEPRQTTPYNCNPQQRPSVSVTSSPPLPELCLNALRAVLSAHCNTLLLQGKTYFEVRENHPDIWEALQNDEYFFQWPGGVCDAGLLGQPPAWSKLHVVQATIRIRTEMVWISVVHLCFVCHSKPR